VCLDPVLLLPTQRDRALLSQLQHPVGEVQRVERKSSAIRKAGRSCEWETRRGKDKKENPRSLMKSDKAQVDQKCWSLQSGQQIVFAARTLAGWQLRVFGKEQDIK